MSIPLIWMIVFAYLLGSIPFGLVIYYLKTGKDLRKIGSGNIGATNIYRAAGAKLGLLTLLCDGGKAAFASLVALWLFGENQAVVVSLAAIIGHNYSIFLRFSGGKGVASSFAVMLVLNWQVAIAGAVMWLAMFGLFRTSSVAALIGFATICLASLFLVKSLAIFMAISCLTGLIFIKHASNIKRIMQGVEPQTMQGGADGEADATADKKYFSPLSFLHRFKKDA